MTLAHIAGMSLEELLGPLAATGTVIAIVLRARLQARREVIKSRRAARA
jgi:hypothetical protein